MTILKEVLYFSIQFEYLT